MGSLNESYFGVCLSRIIIVIIEFQILFVAFKVKHSFLRFKKPLLNYTCLDLILKTTFSPTIILVFSSVDYCILFLKQSWGVLRNKRNYIYEHDNKSREPNFCSYHFHWLEITNIAGSILVYECHKSLWETRGY